MEGCLLSGLFFIPSEHASELSSGYNLPKRQKATSSQTSEGAAFYCR